MQVKQTTLLEILEQKANKIMDQENPSNLSLLDSLDTNDAGIPYGSLENCMKIFSMDPLLRGGIAKNEMTGRIELVKNLGWNEVGTTLTDQDEYRIFLYFEKNYAIRNDKRIRQALIMTASENRYHPVKKYLESLTWDGVNRIDTLMNKYLGVDVNDYTKEVMHLLMRGMIHRVYHPGCKFEIMVCLVGGQGIGKSSFFRFLSGKEDWFSDDLKKLDDEKVYRKLQGHWLIEMSEMLATANARSIEDIKSFLSRQKDNYKIPYEVHPEDRPRQCVFVGTSNNMNFLPLDRSGNRRFAPIMVHANQVEHHILENEEESQAYFDQAWAEAFAEYQNEEKHILKFSYEVEKYLKEIQVDFMPEDSKAGMILSWLDTCKEGYICSLMIYREALNNENDKPKQWELREINEIMNECATDWEKAASHRFERYGTQRAWKRKTINDSGFIKVNEQMELDLPFD